MNYYYLVAALPTINFDETLPISVEELLSICEKSLEPNDFESFKQIMEGSPEKSKNRFIQKWLACEIQFRNALARMRAGKADDNNPVFQREHEGFDVWIERTATTIMSIADPLDREKALDMQRWGLIDELNLDEPYGVGAVLGFALKFKIAEKWALRTLEQGRKKVSEFVKGSLREINNE